MNDLTDLYRNIDFLDEYDEQSFMGLIVNKNIWSDEEYWKLDEALCRINQIYPYPSDIPRDICAMVVHIAVLMMVPYRVATPVEQEMTSYDIDVLERYERLIFILQGVFTGDELDASYFGYHPDQQNTLIPIKYSKNSKDYFNI